MSSNNSIQKALQFFIAPGLLVSFVLTLINLTKKVENQKLEGEKEVNSSTIGVEPNPEKVTIRQALPNETIQKITHGSLDKDIAFVAGESEMRLDVYESPFMYQYRKFKNMRKDENTEGYYVVDKNKEKQKETLFLYGRGPIFKYQDEYSDRFEGIDD